MVVCILCPIMWLQEPIKKPPPPKRNTKAGRNAKRKIKPPKVQAKPEKPKKAKKAKWAKAPQLSEYEQREFDRYTFDNSRPRVSRQ